MYDVEKKGSRYSKFTKCLRLLYILKSSAEPIGREALALKLNTTKRNITEYVKEINDVFEDLVDGAMIERNSGRYNSGYYISNNFKLLTLDLSGAEMKNLKYLYEYISNRASLPNQNDILVALEKVLSTSGLDIKDYIIEYDDSKLNYILKTIQYEQYPIRKDHKVIDAHYYSIYDALKNKQRVKINYAGVSKTQTIIVEPYALYSYFNYHFLAKEICTIKDDISIPSETSELKPYKIYRINDIEVLSETYEIDHFYDKKQYFDKYGFKDPNDKKYKVELIVNRRIARLLDERVYGEDQSIVRINSKKYSFKCIMRNKRLVKKFILGLGRECQIVSPKGLKNELIEEVQVMLKNYNL